MTTYQYSALPRSGHIRLLQLLPDKEDLNKIRCMLITCQLQDSERTNRPYEALSYVWGSELKPKRISIVEDPRSNGEEDQRSSGKVAITDELHAILLRLRDRDIPRIIWIDAVCIDQSKVLEKAHQIPLMAKIYANATTVLVWLGYL